MAEQIDVTPTTDAELMQEASLARQSIPSDSILSVIKEAVLNKSDAETMQLLLNIRREERADQAREAFANALVQFRRMVKPIIMTGKRDDRLTGGKVHYPYAELTTTVEQIQSILDQCGLTPTWAMVKSEPAYVEVECILTHGLGHKESSLPLGAKPEGPPGQTDVQKRVGTITSLRRATLFMVLGLTTKEDDRHLKDQEQGQEPKTPASQNLMNTDEAEKKARAEFAATVRKKLQLAEGEDLKGGFLRKVLANVQQASGKESVADCAAYLDSDDVLVSADGTLGFVNDAAFEEVPPDAADRSTAGPSTSPPPDGAIPAPELAPDPPAFKWQCTRCGRQMPVKPASGLCPGDGQKKCLGKVVEIGKESKT